MDFNFGISLEDIDFIMQDKITVDLVRYIIAMDNFINFDQYFNEIILLFMRKDDLLC